MNGVSQSVPTTFEPDDSTAQITAANLTVVRDNASANGTETNEVKAMVTDAGNNLLSGHVVSFEADNGGGDHRDWHHRGRWGSYGDSDQHDCGYYHSEGHGERRKPKCADHV
ncbi:Ig-like domain-containing protein [Yersinia massiliensis]|uniref:Ig-like domain-containing protein n=1 Tax=Yersinia massiliensis TaxID=419257 RepID=UPI002AD51C2E|nr:Ig-like domain-containing protein [Yersinia massiliensis]